MSTTTTLNHPSPKIYRRKVDLEKAFRDFVHFTAQQAARILNCNEDSVNRSLRVLASRKRGKLYRTKIVVSDLAAPFLYWAGKPEMGSDSPLHEYQTTEIHIVLRDALKGDLLWMQEGISDQSFAPDAVFLITREGGKAFALELERSKASQVEITTNAEAKRKINSRVAKALSFMKFRERNKIKRKWPEIADLHQVFIFRHSGMVLGFLRQMIDAGLPYRTFYVTDYDTFISNPLGKIFQTPRDYHQGVTYSLLD